jgi:hypothetical protein
VKEISFELLELEMADLEHFWRKTPLGPLGVKVVVLEHFFVKHSQEIIGIEEFGSP